MRGFWWLTVTHDGRAESPCGKKSSRPTANEISSVDTLGRDCSIKLLRRLQMIGVLPVDYRVRKRALASASGISNLNLIHKEMSPSKS